LIPEVGLAGQEKLRAARVLVIGAGGLGAPVLQYLAAAGVGTLGIVDDDRVDLSNLQRQVMFAESDIGQFKALAAGKRANAINAEVEVEAIPIRVDASNVRAFVRGYDVVVDATDTFAARYLINDACRLEGKPDVYASIFRFDGQVSVFAPNGPCYRCLFPEAPPTGSVPTCAEGGVLGVLAGMVGTWQANEVLKSILGIGTPLVGRLALIDALAGRAREVAFASDPACPLHGEHPTIIDVVDSDASASIARFSRSILGRSSSTFANRTNARSAPHHRPYLSRRASSRRGCTSSIRRRSTSLRVGSMRSHVGPRSVCTTPAFGGCIIWKAVCSPTPRRDRISNSSNARSFARARRTDRARCRCDGGCVCRCR
jgi:molybdopterin/thiamine biosynthesis adenylyltransferase